MKKRKKTVKKRKPATQGEKDVQEESTKYKELVPLEHHHGETGKHNEQTPREHPHGNSTPIA
jgi:hypothetical protein